MQDEINEKVIALYIKGGKITAKLLQKAIKLFLAEMKKQEARRQLPLRLGAHLAPPPHGDTGPEAEQAHKRPALSFSGRLAALVCRRRQHALQSAGHQALPGSGASGRARGAGTRPHGKYVV